MSLLRLATLAALTAAPAWAQCPGGWAPGFGEPGFDQFISAMATLDDGSGPALYVGGSFTRWGDEPVSKIARREGGTWAPIGAGLGPGNGTVHGLIIHDDGRGAALFAGGDFSHAEGRLVNSIARWSGTRWEDLAGGVNGTVRNALLTYDDGTGPALYVGGNFTAAGGAQALRLARWDGAGWSAVGGGVSGEKETIRALAIFDDGRGPAMYVAGSFASAGGVAASNVARWDGARWEALGEGVNDLVRGMIVFDDGSGPALYLTGHPTLAGGKPVNRIARWDGRQWSAVGDGFNDIGRRMVIHDDGAGPALLVVGNFTEADGRPAPHVARWDGSAWSGLGTGLDGNVFGVASLADEAGPSLYVGGFFAQAGGYDSGMVARWMNRCAGDMNCDGRIDGFDLDPFTLAVSDPAAFAAQYPGCPRLRADVNGDDLVDERDIEPMLKLLAPD
ncbi:MAG: hypothetical protein ACF8R7_13115 [Phycisphaerales bacterium JB039]